MYGPGSTALRVAAAGRDPGQLADLWLARLAVKTLRRDQREAIAEAAEG